MAATTTLQLADKNAGGGCGCGCGCSSSESAATQDADVAAGGGVATQTFLVTGMTCGHCVGAVRDEVSQIPGVVAVDVTLVPSGTSTLVVTSTAPVPADAVAAALDQAGDYQLAG